MDKLNYTTHQASKELMDKLGLPADSADMCYTINDDTKMYNTIPTCIPYKQFTAKKYYLPCWSAFQLMKIFDTCYKLEFENDDEYPHWPPTYRMMYADNSAIEYFMGIFRVAVLKKQLDFSKLEK